MPEPIDAGQPVTPEIVTPAPESTPAPVVAPVELTPARGNEDVTKLKEQVSNLTLALQKEREDGGKRVQEFEKKLDDKLSVLDKIGQVFNPVEAPIQQPTQGFSKEDLDKMLEDKMSQFKDEQVQNQKIEEYKGEIRTLETQWDGKEGKPKYDDADVLNWQRDNQKTYLSPKDAFFQMKHQEILDFEVKQRLSKGTPVQNVETPSTVPGTHEPSKEDSAKNATLNTRQAVLQALEDAGKEM